MSLLSAMRLYVSSQNDEFVLTFLLLFFSPLSTIGDNNHSTNCCVWISVLHYHFKGHRHVDSWKKKWSHHMIQMKYWCEKVSCNNMTCRWLWDSRRTTWSDYLGSTWDSWQTSMFLLLPFIIPAYGYYFYLIYGALMMLLLFLFAGGFAQCWWILQLLALIYWQSCGRGVY